MSDAKKWLEIDKKILGDAFTSNETGDVLYTLCDEIGPRFAGTEGFQRSAEFVESKFNEYGLDTVEGEPFEFTSWRRGKPAELSMTEPLERGYPCFALPYGAPTGAAGVTAEMIDIGPGAKKDIEAVKDDIRGKIVFTSAGGAHRSEIYGRVTEAGAVGFIMVNGATGMLLPTGCVKFGHKGTIPAVGIPSESGSEIQRLAKGRKIVLKVVTHDSFASAVSCNVVGEIKGTEKPEELAIIGGHLDSHDIAPGAMDNAAGSTIVIETARLLAGQRKHLKRSVRFILFGAEEVGLLGSYHHAKAHAAEMPNVRLMMNVDCPPTSRPKGLVFHKWDEAEDYVKKLRGQMNEELPLHNGVHQHSDHFPFVLQGVPSAEIAGGKFGAGVNNYGHMAGDTAEKISLIDLREGAAFAARILLRAVNDESWPFKQRTPEQVDKLLEETGIKEAMKFEGQ